MGTGRGRRGTGRQVDRGSTAIGNETEIHVSEWFDTTSAAKGSI